MKAMRTPLLYVALALCWNIAGCPEERNKKLSRQTSSEFRAATEQDEAICAAAAKFRLAQKDVLVGNTDTPPDTCMKRITLGHRTLDLPMSRRISATRAEVLHHTHEELGGDRGAIWTDTLKMAYQGGRWVVTMRLSGGHRDTMKIRSLHPWPE